MLVPSEKKLVEFSSNDTQPAKTGRPQKKGVAFCDCRQTKEHGEVHALFKCVVTENATTFFLRGAFLARRRFFFIDKRQFWTMTSNATCILRYPLFWDGPNYRSVIEN